MGLEESNREYQNISERGREVIQALREHVETDEVTEFEMPLAEIKSMEFVRAVADLKKPYEIAFTQNGDRGIVSTGVNDSQGVAGAGPMHVVDRLKDGELSGHSHPGPELLDLVPSITDIEILGMGRAYSGAKTPPWISNSAGLLVFQFDPDWASKENSEDSPGKYSYALKNQCSWKWDELVGAIRNKQIDVDSALKDWFAYLQDRGIIRFCKPWEDLTEEDKALAGLSWVR